MGKSGPFSFRAVARMVKGHACKRSSLVHMRWSDFSLVLSSMDMSQECINDHRVAAFLCVSLRVLVHSRAAGLKPQCPSV